VGFTALSERLSPAEIAQLLNGLFEEMLQEVFALGGTWISILVIASWRFLALLNLKKTMPTGLLPPPKEC
jgi:class 3 adenylate cyclase